MPAPRKPKTAEESADESVILLRPAPPEEPVIPRLPVRYLKVDLSEIEYPGFYVTIRATLTNSQFKQIDFDYPGQVAYLFGEHNLVDEDGPLPDGGTEEFVWRCPRDIQHFAFQKAVVHIYEGGRTKTEKKPDTEN